MQTKIKASDNTMEPVICKGDIVVIDKTHCADDGTLALVRSGESVLIRYIKRALGGWTLSTAAPCVRTSFVPDADFKILGRVAEIQKP